MDICCKLIKFNHKHLKVKVNHIPKVLNGLPMMQANSALQIRKNVENGDLVRKYYQKLKFSH
jgi:hypothetical protein